jgi:AcrR family transcriptional regulator
MARIIKEEDYSKKRNEILNAAESLLYTKGYESMAIRDILTDLKISSGAFFHYFDSKLTLLEALIERMMTEAEKQLLPIVHHLHLSATEKLGCYFGTLDRLKTERKSFLLGMMRGWYSDDNAIVRQKINDETIKRRTPLLSLIVSQGIQEGVFLVSYPSQAAEVILSLSLSMGDALARLMLSSQADQDETHYIDNIVASHNAYIDAIERVLQAPAHFLNRLDTGAVRDWLDGEDA